MNKIIRFGIIGSGGIATLWLKGARQVEDVKVVAIHSLDLTSAKELAKTFDIPSVEESYEAMLQREDIDAIYVGTPHTFHYENALKALNHGKHVLCEKPMGINQAQAVEMFDTAKRNNCFLMEAMWMRFFPAMQQLRDVIASGAIGRVRNIRATFAYNIGGLPKTHRLLNPALAGGALLDVGVYCLHFCNALLREHASQMTGFASINSTEEAYGVDEQCNIIAEYPDSVLAFLCCAVLNDMGEDATIYGEKGRIVLPVFWKPTTYTIINEEGSKTVTVDVPQLDNDLADVGYQYEIKHVADCIRKGKLESPEMTHETSLKILEQSDELRASWKLVYPDEK